MDDRRSDRALATSQSQSILLVPLKRCVACLAIASIVWTLGGCSIFVMAGKMFFGDPVRTSPFRATTDVNLTKGEKSVLIIARTPQSVKAEIPAVDLVIVEQVSRILRTKGVKMYPSKKVLNWVDNRGGHWGDASEIARAFPDANYIVEVDVEQFTHREDNSPDLYRGRAVGNIQAFEVIEVAGSQSASPVFSRTFNCTYPTMHPKQAHQISEKTFQEEFLGRVCVQIAQMFYDIRPSESIF